MNLRSWLSCAAALSAVLAAREANAACAITSPTRICVGYDDVNGGYTVDTGAGPVRQGPLTMTRGTMYTLEVDPAEESSSRSIPSTSPTTSTVPAPARSSRRVCRPARSPSRPPPRRRTRSTISVTSTRTSARR